MAFFTADQIDAAPTLGRQGRWHYRRVRLDDVSYDGCVKYSPELEDLVDDVADHIVGELNRLASRISYGCALGRLYSPVEIPLPAPADR